MLSMVRCFSMSNFFICFQFDCVICFQFDCVLSDEFLLLIFLRVAQKRLKPAEVLQIPPALDHALRERKLRREQMGNRAEDCLSPAQSVSTHYLAGAVAPVSTGGFFVAAAHCSCWWITASVVTGL